MNMRVGTVFRVILSCLGSSLLRWLRRPMAGLAGCLLLYLLQCSCGWLVVGGWVGGGGVGFLVGLWDGGLFYATNNLWCVLLISSFTCYFFKNFGDWLVIGMRQKVCGCIFVREFCANGKIG